MSTKKGQRKRSGVENAASKSSDVSKKQVIEGDDVVGKGGIRKGNVGGHTQPVAMEQSVTEHTHGTGTTVLVEERVDEGMVEEKAVEQAWSRTLALPTREQWLSWVPFLGVIVLGAILRFWGLGDKPLHHDESLHAYFSLQLMHNNFENWSACAKGTITCYHYDPLLHGPFQFHMIALVYKISQWLGVFDHGVNTTTVRIGAATLGTVIVGLPYFLRSYLGRTGAWLASFLLAVSPSMVYFARFAREDIYMACFTLLMVVAAGNYVRSRKGSWLVIAAVSFILSYATKEATFLSIAIFGSFLAMLIVWEIGLKWTVRANVRSNVWLARYVPKTGAPIGLFIFMLVLAPLVKWFFGWMKDLSIYVNDPKNSGVATQFVQNLKNNTVAMFPWIGIILGVYVLSILAREMLGMLPVEKRRGLAKRVDAQEQPMLDTLLTMPWTHWFFALMSVVVIFMVLYTALFTYIPNGIGDGIWQGLYYWLQQQQVARGGQPWYYYLMLIPLYEQIGLVFGIVGLIRCLLRPSRFRIFLVYWFVGNTFIYSWAGEKMPWLMIHMVMPMILLAAMGLEPVVLRIVSLTQGWSEAKRVTSTSGKRALEALPVRPKLALFANGGVLIGGIIAVLLLVVTLQNMVQVSYVHAADGPHEMMIYVQTTQDVHTVMGKLDALDQQKFGGQHKMVIGVMNDAEWPFYWYLRDYTNVCYGYPNGCATTNPAVILTGGDNLFTSQAQYSNSINGKEPDYLFKQYHLRMWWDEGYKPVPCVPSKADACTGQPTWGGVGALTWLSYGDTPPAPGAVDIGKAANNIWQWWWQRKAIGSTQGSTDMGLFIRKDLSVKP